MFALLLQAAAQASEEGVTGGELLADIPHDAPAIVIYLLLAVSIGWVIVAGRRKGRTDGDQ